MKIKSRFLLLTLALILALAPAASGQYLKELGPICAATENQDGTFSGGHGFPLFVGDGTHQLELGVLPDPVIPSNALSAHTGFGAESFYYICESEMEFRFGNQRIRPRLTLAVEAAYGAEDPLNHDQFLFVRTRFRMDTPAVGQYTVLHPWGTEVFQVVATEAELIGANYHLLADGINFTYDWGGFAPLPECELTAEQACFYPESMAPGFERILLSPKQGPFLVQTGFPGETGLLGDGTPATITGSPVNQNFFRVEGPAGANLDGQGNNVIQTDLFTVNGRLYTGGGCAGGGGGGGGGGGEEPPPQPADTVTITQATFNPNSRWLDVRATSDSTDAVTLTVTGNGFPETTLVNGRARIRVAAGVNPFPITVTSTGGGSATFPAQ
jgi:hypothetical protein